MSSPSQKDDDDWLGEWDPDDKDKDDKDDDKLDDLLASAEASLFSVFVGGEGEQGREQRQQPEEGPEERLLLQSEEGPEEQQQQVDGRSSGPVHPVPSEQGQAAGDEGSPDAVDEGEAEDASSQAGDEAGLGTIFESGDDDDYDERDSSPTPKPSKRRRSARPKVRNRYIEDEAEVSDDEEDLDEDDAEYAREAEDFIDPDGALAEEDAADSLRAERDHHRLDTRRLRAQEIDAEKLAADVVRRHRSQKQRAYQGDTDALPQSLLVPGVEDPKLWQVRVKPGFERRIVISLFGKALDLEDIGHALEIYSAFQRESLPGLVYVEAHTRAAVERAIDGLVNVYAWQGFMLVPVDEMVALLRLTKKRITPTPGSYVRFKRGRYKGDLAEVIDVSENGEEVGLRFMPRIDFAASEKDETGKKRYRKGTMVGTLANRPQQKLFSVDEVQKIHGRSSIKWRHGRHIFQGETYVEGFIEKDIPVSLVETDNIMPTMDELEVFRGDQAEQDYTRIREQARVSSLAALQPGDAVQVMRDQNKGAVGTVINVAGAIVTIRRTLGEAAGSELAVRGEFVQKIFRIGEHVKVVDGPNVDETGLVLRVEGEVTTLISDLSHEEISLFSRNLRVVAEIGSGLNVVGQHELHDLIPLEGPTFGVIIRTERDVMHVLDNHGQVRSLKPHLVSNKLDVHSNIITYDTSGQPIRRGEMVFETKGEGRSGTVIGLRGLTVFVYNRNIQTNEGVFICSPRELISSASKTANVQLDLTKLNPTIGALGGVRAGGTIQRRRYRDPLLDTPVVIVRGIHKSRVGIITDINGEVCRVELQATNQTVTINKTALRQKDLRTGAISNLPVAVKEDESLPSALSRSGAYLGSPFGSSRMVNPYANDGGRTPSIGGGGGSGSGTAYASNGNATPTAAAWGFSAATPSRSSSGRTPMHKLGRGTPGPPVNVRTPAYTGVQEAQTSTARILGVKTPYGAGQVVRTPAYSRSVVLGDGGGATPNLHAFAVTPGRTPGSGGGRLESTPAWMGSAATPYGAGGSAFRDAPTPAPPTPNVEEVNLSSVDPPSSSSQPSQQSANKMTALDGWD